MCGYHKAAHRVAQSGEGARKGRGCGRRGIMHFSVEILYNQYMSFWGFIFGLFIGLFPIIVLNRMFRGRFMGIENLYLKGVIFGFLVWALSGFVIYIDLSYDLFGFMKKENGGPLLRLFFSSHYGFLTCGLGVAFIDRSLSGLINRAKNKQ